MNTFVFDRLPGHLIYLVAQAEEMVAALDDDRWRASRGERKWNRLQLLGHLINSAANNHQRFVRALAQPRLDWPGYDQEAHVAVQHYANADPKVCFPLWASYNRHIAHVLRQITGAKTSTPCRIDGASEMTLSQLALDYVAHLEHHIRQMLDSSSVRYSGMPWPPTDPNRQWPV